ncbi:MAG: hypothetical protein FK732_04380 [Asgard group archaeon]|nr:hypothetical protein [Asgard group archaeon]
MDAGSVMGLYILTSSVGCLIFNFLMYRLAFRRQKRMKANGYSWVSSLGFIAAVNVGLIFAFAPLITGVSNAFEAEVTFLVLIPSLTWFVPASLYTLIRAFFILISKNREREILSNDIEAAEIISNESIQ